MRGKKLTELENKKIIGLRKLESTFKEIPEMTGIAPATICILCKRLNMNIQRINKCKVCGKLFKMTSSVD